MICAGEKKNCTHQSGDGFFSDLFEPCLTVKEIYLWYPKTGYPEWGFFAACLTPFRLIPESKSGFVSIHPNFFPLWRSRLSPRCSWDLPSSEMWSGRVLAVCSWVLPSSEMWSGRVLAVCSWVLPSSEMWSGRVLGVCSWVLPSSEMWSGRVLAVCSWVLPSSEMWNGRVLAVCCQLRSGTTTNPERAKANSFKFFFFIHRVSIRPYTSCATDSS